MSLRPEFSSVVATLQKLPQDSVTQVIVRPAHNAPALMDKGNGAFTDAYTPDEFMAVIDPKNFDSHLEYRKALIARHKAMSDPQKKEMVALAEKFGLAAHPASSLNAVLVEGKVEAILKFIDQPQVAGVMLDETIKLKR